jgi:hypothetical protein
VRAAPATAGSCGAPGRAPGDQAPSWWAARYAARPTAAADRVGLTNATSLAALTPEAARGALGALARATHLAGLPLDEAVAQGLDPRTVRQPGSRAPRPRGTARGG